MTLAFFSELFGPFRNEYFFLFPLLGGFLGYLAGRLSPRQ
jgi:hypothetical protein